MVKEDTHLFLAEQVLQRLPKGRLKRLVEENRAYYDLGAVLPDAFFYSRSLQKISERLHGKQGELTNKLLLSVLEKLKERPDEQSKALLLGYLTHVAFDSVFHPTVYHFAGNYYASERRMRKQAVYLHRQLETALQRQLKNKAKISERSKPRLVEKTIFPDLIREEFGIPKKAVIRCLSRQKIISRNIHKRGVYALLRVLARHAIIDWTLLSFSYQNLSYDGRSLNASFTYQDPASGKRKRDSIDGLVAAGIKRSLEYISAAERYLEGKMTKTEAWKVIDGVSLDSGHVGIGTKKMRHFARTSSTPFQPFKRFVNEDGESHVMPLHRIPGYVWRRISPWRRAARKKEGFTLPQRKPNLKAKGDFLIWLGHCSFLLKLKGKWLLIDPVLTTPFATLRLADPPLSASRLPKIDYLLISHGHPDHLDRKTIKQLSIGEGLLPRRMGKLLQKMKKELQVQEAGWHETYDLGDDLSVTLLPAKHYHQRSLFDSNTALWGGFLIEWSKKKLFFCGDSGYASHFKEIGNKYGPIDYCLMPIGAYAPGWLEDKSHMTPEESLKAFKDLKGKTFIPMHYGTFDLSDEPMAEPIERLVRARKKEQIIILQPGKAHRL